MPSEREQGGPATKKARTEPSGSYATDDAFYRLLLGTNAEDFVESEKTIFVAERTDKVHDVWKGMLAHNILSVPVLQKTKHRYFGFLDVADIVRYLADKYSKEETKGSEHFWTQIKEADAFEELTVDDIMKYPVTIRNPFHPVHKGFSLLHVVELLGKEDALHRVPIVNEDRKLVNLVTQSKVVSYLGKHISLLGDRAKQPLGKCPELFHSVVSIQDDRPAIEAFNIMVEKHLSGVAVINKQGDIIGSVALRDLKCIGNQGHVRNFWRFYMPLHSFIAHLKKEFQTIHNRPHKVVYATEDDTIESAVQKLLDAKVHRLFLVDKITQKKPVGVVSLKDILFEILKC